jgi:hypothetical protein
MYILDGGLSTGEKAAISKGQTLKHIDTKEKIEGARRYAKDHGLKYHEEGAGAGGGGEDKRHSDPAYGGLSTGEKAALSRGQMPESVASDPEKKAGGEKYLREHLKK